MTGPEDEITSTGEPSVPRSRDLEAPEEDLVEQTTPANPADEPEEVRLDSEVDEYDAVEQARVVDLDDEYR